MDVVTRVIQGWRDTAVDLNPGASAASLDRLKAALGLPLPDDVVAFYSAANGMADSATAEWLTSFWSIEKILSQRLEREGQDRTGAYRELAFADVMLDSWYLWFRMRPTAGLSFFVDDGGEEHASFTAALEHYLRTSKGWD